MPSPSSAARSARADVETDLKASAERRDEFVANRTRLAAMIVPCSDKTLAAEARANG
jgi:hypothetical protein